MLWRNKMKELERLWMLYKKDKKKIKMSSGW